MKYMVEHVRWICGQKITKNEHNEIFVTITTGSTFYLAAIHRDRICKHWWCMPASGNGEFYLLSQRFDEAIRDAIDILKPQITGKIK